VIHGLHEALKSAAADTAKFMTSELRHHALSDGWDPEVANSLHVHYDGKSYGVHIPEEHYNKAFEHEYGTESTRPLATIRKFSNNTANAEAALSKFMDRRV
jgi:hypothetical protein